MNYDFRDLLDMDRAKLLETLADTHTVLANLHEEIAYTRATEITTASTPSVKATRMHMEGQRDAMIEKKFLLIRLIESHA